jgi:GT2 family glycosyltransferase
MISIVIVLWKSAGFVKECLRSILDQSFTDFELILIDNNPDSLDRAQVQSFTDRRITYISSGKNSGFAAGQNAGIRQARSEWVFCLNSDTILPPGYLGQMAGILSTMPPDTGMVGTRVLSEKNHDLIDSDGLAMTRHRFFFDADAGKKAVDLPALTDTPLLGACACGVFFRKRMIDAVSVDNQFFDEDFFCFYEDADVCWRCMSAGWKFMVLPAPVFFHWRHGTASRESVRKLKSLTFRNRYWVIIKNDSLADCLRDWPSLLCMELVNFVKLLRYPYLARAYYQAIAGLPRMLKKRTAISKMRTIKKVPKAAGAVFLKRYFFS